MNSVLAEDLSCLLDFLDEREAASESEADRRSEPRRSQWMIVELIPLDGSLRPCGDMRLGISRNISPHGASLFAEMPPEAQYGHLAFSIPQSQRIETLIQVAWRHQFGTMCELGGPVVTADARRAHLDAPRGAGLVPLQP